LIPPFQGVVAILQRIRRSIAVAIYEAIIKCLSGIFLFIELFGAFKSRFVNILLKFVEIFPDALDRVRDTDAADERYNQRQEPL
jgi:hypothetical protein